MDRIHEGVLLTVDDGPSERAGNLIDYLSQRQIGAIFFCQGDRLIERKELGIRAVNEGYIIGNHSYDHPDFRDLTGDQANDQIARTDDEIERLYNNAGRPRPAKYFRFPYGQGRENAAHQSLLRQNGYWSPLNGAQCDWTWDIHVTDWQVDAGNVAHKLEVAKTHLTSRLRNGQVLLMHDHPQNLDLELFQCVCEHVLEMGFKFCTNAQLHEQAAVR